MPRSPVPVDDADDPRLADYLRLSDAALRRRVERERRVFIVEGLLAIEALISSPYEVRSVLVDRRGWRRLADVLRDVDAPVFLAPDDVVRSTVGFDLHRGAVASATRPDDAVIDATRFAADGRARRLLVLEGVNDHENLGAIFRNAAAFGVDAVLLDPTCADPLYRRSVRVSLGHVLRVPFARVAWPETLDVLHAEGWQTLALAPQGERDLDDLARGGRHAPEVRDARVALLLGAEGPGLAPATMQAASQRVRISLAPGVDSLNVATAAAVALHALGR